MHAAPSHLTAALLVLATMLASTPLLGQGDVDTAIEDIDIPQQRLPLCFGISDIREERALAICDALHLDENVRARELADRWVSQEPDNPAAQFALAEVLFTVEGNMPRALYHLNRAEALTGYTTLEEAFDSGQLQWHYLALSQLSYIHQLMGNQRESLAYLDKISEIYGQDVESFRGWPLIKLKDYEAARTSANTVLRDSDDERARARAWNTLCAVELASLQPIESMGACERTINEDDGLAGGTDTVYLTNASEVALSLLQMDKAEEYLDRATRNLNPGSVADPWIYKLYLTMNQGRFDEARTALDRMLVWREQQEPIVNVMNRAEHFLVSAAFLLLAGYADDAVKLSGTALNQPDRNGSYSSDDAQKDSYAALINMMAHRTAYQQRLETLATRSRLQALSGHLQILPRRLAAWQAERRAASLLAQFDILQNRLRPYAPLDVHIPEWIEPEIIRIVGPGVMANLLDQARVNGAFQLNEGYYHAYRAEIAAVSGRDNEVLAAGEQALAILPEQEVLLRARMAARMAESSRKTGNRDAALLFLQQALIQDPSILRRLELSIPVLLSHDGSALAREAQGYLQRSPRFHQADFGLVLTIEAQPSPTACLTGATGPPLSCYTLDHSESQDDENDAQALVRLFQEKMFGLGFDISKAQRSMLLGSSVILRSRGTITPDNRNPFLVR